MFKVLIGGRQTGATTKLVNMIKKDIEKELKVGIYGKMIEVDRIKNQIHNSQRNKYLFTIVGDNEYKSMDKIYILNILEIGEDRLNRLRNYFDEIWCDKPTPLPTFSKIEFDIAKEYKYESEIKISDLIKFIDFGVDLKLVFNYMKSPLTRKDIQFVRYEESFSNIKRLEWMQVNPNHYCEFTGIIFK